jgi:glycosyltransferase involved in cell wall biosynthesis
MTRTLTVALLTLGDPNRTTGGYLYHRRMADLAPRHDAHVRFVSLPDGPLPRASLAVPAGLWRIRRLHPQAIVLDSIVAAATALWPLDGLGGAPVVAMLHQAPGGIDGSPLRRAALAPLDRMAYRRARKLLVASESLAEELAAHVPHARLEIVPPGRDVAQIPAGTEEDLRCGRRAAFLCVGNWVARKDILSLLDAFARLPPDAATLHLVGDENADPHYASWVRRRLVHPVLSGRVVVHGVIPGDEVARLYAAADAFVLPSLREPYGTVYGEALAAGLPVVGWRAGNLPYLIQHELEGLMIRPGDVDGLTVALHRMAYDEDRRREMSEAAQRRGAALPTWEDTAARFFGAIREAVEAA